MSAIWQTLRVALGIDASPGALFVIALLVAARLAPIAWLAPYAAPLGSPTVVRSATLAALVIALLPLASLHASIPDSGLALALAIAREVAIGAALLVATSVPLVAMEHVGRGLDAWRGSDGSDAAGPYARLYAALALAAFVAIGGLRVVTRALGSGLVALPVGSTSGFDAEGLLEAAQIGVQAITFAVALGAPAMVALLAAEVGLALAARAARFGRLLDQALGLRSGLVLGAAMLALAAALPELPALTTWAMRATSSLVAP